MWKQDEKGNWTYFDNDTQVFGWRQIDGRWYYFYEKEDTTKGQVKGNMAIGWVEVQDGKWYYFYKETDEKACNYKGSMATSWIQDEGHWYYLSENSDSSEGMMQKGWIQYQNKWYYLLENTDESKSEYKGQMVASTRTIHDEEYSFNSDGSWIEHEGLLSPKGISYCKSWEGFYANKYYDCVGVLTQGYGMTGDEIANLPALITEETAATLLESLIDKKYAQKVKADLDSKGVELQQNEFDALVSFAYNCGTDALLNKSTLYKNIVAGVKDVTTITSNFQAWSNDGEGNRIDGLYRRRTSEAAMFLKADYTGNI